MPISIRKSFSALLVTLCFAAPALAQVSLKRGAVVYHGSASNTTAPAVIDESRVKESTREWMRIQSEGIDPASAQGRQLLGQMNQRVRDAVRAIAGDQSKDLVVGKDDISDRQGKDVTDLTDLVIAKLGT